MRRRYFVRSAGAHRSENAGMSSERAGQNPCPPVAFKVSRGRLVRPGLVGAQGETERCIRSTTGDIPVLEYIVMEGRSRLTKPDNWKCLAKQ